MSDAPLQIPVSDQVRKTLKLFLTGFELGRRIREIFWLAERSWLKDCLYHKDGRRTSDDLLKSVSEATLSLLRWMSGQNCFAGEDIRKLGAELNANFHSLRMCIDPPVSNQDPEYSSASVEKPAAPADSRNRLDANQLNELRKRRSDALSHEEALEDPEVARDCLPPFCQLSPFLFAGNGNFPPLFSAIQGCCRSDNIVGTGCSCGFITSSDTYPVIYLPRDWVVAPRNIRFKDVLTEALDLLSKPTGDHRLKQLKAGVDLRLNDDADFSRIGEQLLNIITSIIEIGVLPPPKAYAFGLQLIAENRTIGRDRFQFSVQANKENFDLLRKLASASDQSLAYEFLKDDEYEGRRLTPMMYQRIRRFNRDLQRLQIMIDKDNTVLTLRDVPAATPPSSVQT